MTDVAAPSLAPNPDFSAKRLRRRYAAERRFQLYGLLAILAAVAVLGLLLFTVVRQGYTAFTQTEIALEIRFDPEVIDPDGGRDPEALARADYQLLVKRALYELFPEVTKRREKRRLAGLVSSGAGFTLRTMVMDEPELIGRQQRVWVKSSDDVDSFMKGFIDRDLRVADRRIKDDEIQWIDALEARGDVATRFNSTFFTAGDSREPEQAGILGAAVGSFLTLVVTLLLSFPLGVLAAVYLEEFAPKNRWTDLIEVNINNLAAVPSIIFGLLGLAVFLNFMGSPRARR